MIHGPKQEDINAQGEAAVKSVELYFSPYFNTAEESAASSQELSYQSHTLKDLTGKFDLDPNFRA